MQNSFICLLILNFCKFGQLFHLNDEEVLSDIKLFNKSYAELRFLPSNQSMNVWLKTYLSEEKEIQRIIDGKCVFNGEVVMGEVIKGTAILSFCSEVISGIFDFNGTLYSLNPYNSWNSSSLRSGIQVRSKRRVSARNILTRIKHDHDEIAICANAVPDLGKVMTRNSGYELGQDNPDVRFGKATIQVSAFMDELLFKLRFQSNMTSASQFIGINFAYLQKQLQQKNILRNIDIKIVVVHFSIAPFYDTHQWDVYTYHRTFCNWVRDNTTHYSHVNILFTGATLWWIVDGKFSTSIKGLASVGELCDRWYSCMTIEAREGFKSVRTLVHEFGHNLGAEHDGQAEDNTQSCDSEAHIMSWAVGSGKTTWSECSAKNIRLLMLSKKRDEKTNRVKCLMEDNKPMNDNLDLSKANYRMPGLKTTPDQQCQSAFGSKFTFYDHAQDNICMELKCKDDFFTIRTWGTLEGTECGGNRKCFNDRCRRMPLGDFNKYVKLTSSKNIPKIKYVTNLDSL